VLVNVSCTSSTACVAVGSYVTGNHSAVVTDRGGGVRWAIGRLQGGSARRVFILLGGRACRRM